MAVHDHGALAAAAAQLRDAGAPVSVLCAACAEVVELLDGDAVSDSESSQLEAAGVLEAAVLALRSDRGSSHEVLRAALFKVCHAAMRRCAARAVVAAGLVEPSLLALSSSNSEVLVQCLKVLSGLAMNRNCAHALVRGGVVALVACGAPSR